ncbi:MAG: hypothetical protein V4648_08250 [Bacteroidota bacterium]
MKKIHYVLLIIIIAFFILALMPINPAKENSVAVSGIVKNIREGGVKDVVFKLENDKAFYYINRGFENGFELNKAKSDFEGKKITLFYAKSWSPLTRFGTTSKHITHLTVNDSVVYSEW